MSETTHDEFAEWDAAYVLGALSASERAAYERHLAQCATCAEAVGGLAVLPGLLGRVSPENVPADDEPPTPPADLETRTRAAAVTELSAHRRRRRNTLIAAAAAFVFAVTAGGFVIHQQFGDSNPPGVSVAMHEVHTNPLRASIGLRDRAWGTEIAMTCTYPPGAGASYRSTYALYVVDDSGHASSVSTWSAGPGSTSSLTAATAVPRADISRVEVRDTAGAVLLRAIPPTPK
jgi:hypothetical protein